MGRETPRWKRGYVHVYTGSGKGKTTAAFGLALRAAGAGLRVFIAQFVKGMEYGELRAVRTLSEWITVKQYGRRCFIRERPDEQDIEMARRGLEEVRQVIASGEYSVVILDEANIATHFSLFSTEELLSIIATKPPGLELVITGRNADPRVVEQADLVTDMREVKHYYRDGVEARDGIER
jgi:cob(I)alamin adenosyltransferase